MALSRILVAQIVWKHPIQGQAATVVATTHLHHMTAKGEGSGMGPARDRYFEELVRMLKEHKPEVLTGDFNMAMLLVVPRLRRAQLDAELISWYAFRDIHQVRGDAPDAAKDSRGVKKLESVAIITLKRLYKIQAQMTLEMWENPEKLQGFHKKDGPGYPIDSYIGGEDALRNSLNRLRLLEPPNPDTPEAAAVAAEMKMQTAKGKLLKREKWDATQRLWTGAGHMPLIAYFGDGRPCRTAAGVAHREQAAIRRGWGPKPGGRRSALMQRQGRGPPPGHDEYLQREERRRERARKRRRSPAPAAAPADAGPARWGWEEWDGGQGWHQPPWKRERQQRAWRSWSEWRH